MVATRTLAAASQAGRTYSGAYDVKAYGANGDSRKVTDAIITSANGGKTVTSATAAFTAADVGKIIWGVETASGQLRLPVGTITARASATSITVSIAATGAYTGISLVFGSDDSDAIRAAVAAAKAVVPPGKVVLPSGGYIYSKLLFDLEYADSADTISVVGAGSASTILYLHPNFDRSTTSDNQSTILRCANADRLRMRGFTVDPSMYDYDYGNAKLFVVGAAGLLEDVHVVNARSSISLVISGPGTTLIKCSVLNGTEHGFQVNQVSTTFIDCYAGNMVNGYSLLVESVTGSDRFVRWIGGIVDESGLGAVSLLDSVDVSFIGAKLFGPVGAFALTVDGTSKARVTNCEIAAFGGAINGNRSALKVLAGGEAVLSCTRLLGGGTGVALNNAGAVIDAGGNSITGTITGAGTITRPQLSMS